MNSTPSRPPRALVLGGGGSTGNAWLVGVIAGLSDAGLDVTTADVTIGTSAGSTAAAQFAGTSPADLLAAILTAPAPSDPPLDPGRKRPRVRAASDQMARTGALIAAAHDPADMRRRIGRAALALDATPDDAAQARWRATVAGRLPSPRWPERTLLITAVDADTGEPVVFDRDSGVDLVDAVAASCASAFAYRIGERHFVDGGYRRNENADLAAGCARVLVLSPFGGRTRHPEAWGMQLATQVDELRAGGSKVETIVPDAASETLFGANAMDLSLRPAAARAGHDQGRRLAEDLTAFWS